jgi:5-oxoprolinase (ATP-hydrolysing) subunit B
MNDLGAPSIRRLGQSAIVLDAGTSTLRIQRRIWAVARDERVRRHAIEVVAGAGNLTVMFERHSVDYPMLERDLRQAWDDARDAVVEARTVEVPLRYGGADGPDLRVVADRCGLEEDAVVSAHADAEYVVSFLGFLPGFAYLDGLDRRLHLPRREQPRTLVPAGSVAIAGAQSGIYPFDSPGGWHVIGRTQSTLFDPSREPVSLFELGDRVRFVPQ